MDKFEVGKKYLSKEWDFGYAGGISVYECIKRTPKFAIFKLGFAKYDYYAGAIGYDGMICYNLKNIEDRCKIYTCDDKYECVNIDNTYLFANREYIGEIK